MSRIARAWFLMSLLIAGPLFIVPPTSGHCEGEDDQAMASCCDDTGACCCCDETEDRPNDDEQPCSGCECPLMLACGVSPVLVPVEPSQEMKSEEVLSESSLWVRVLTPRHATFELLRPPRA